MNYWCNTCESQVGIKGAAQCLLDNHSLCMSAKESEPTDRLEIIQELDLKAQIAALRSTIHEVHGTLDAVIHASDPLNSMKTWLPIAIRDCRKALGLPVPEIPPLSEDEVELLKKAGFAFKGPDAPKEEWIPKIGDRVWVSGKTWSGLGTVTGFAKDDPEVPWIKVDKDGTLWDARDAGSVRRLEEK